MLCGKTSIHVPFKYSDLDVASTADVCLWFRESCSIVNQTHRFSLYSYSLFASIGFLYSFFFIRRACAKLCISNRFVSNFQDSDVRSMNNRRV